MILNFNFPRFSKIILSIIEITVVTIDLMKFAELLDRALEESFPFVDVVES